MALIGFGLFRLYLAARASTLGRDARQLGRARTMVIPDGLGAWRGPDAVSDLMNVMPLRHSMMCTIIRCRRWKQPADLAALVALVHTSSMLLVMGTIAIVIYEKKSASRFCAARGST